MAKCITTISLDPDTKAEIERTCKEAMNGRRAIQRTGITGERNSGKRIQNPGIIHSPIP